MNSKLPETLLEEEVSREVLDEYAQKVEEYIPEGYKLSGKLREAQFSLIFMLENAKGEEDKGVYITKINGQILDVFDFPQNF